MKKRILSLLCVLALLVGLMPAMAFADGTDSTAYEAGLCEHHTQHDETCGYSEGTEEVPCTHLHDETCGGLTDPASCNHVHDDECGYVPAVAGTPCTFDCAICNGEKDKEECICDTLCTQDSVNQDCPVCSAKDAKLEEVCAGMPVISTLDLEEEDLVATVETEEGETKYYLDDTPDEDNHIYTTAEAALQAAWADCQDKTATLTIHQNVTITKQLELDSRNQKLTLCMDEGVKLTSSSSSVTSPLLIRHGSLELQSGTVEVSYTTIGSSDVTAVAYSSSDASFTLSGGLIQVTSNTKGKVRAVSCSSGDSFNFSGGQIICKNTGNGTAYGVNIYNSDFTMTGGSIEVGAGSGTAYGIYLEKTSSNTTNSTISGGKINAAGYGIYIINSSRPTISGGVEVSASGSGYAAVCLDGSSAKANISGGTFTGTDGAAGFQHISGSTGTLSGGTYSGDTSAVCSNSSVRYLLKSGYAYYKVEGDNVTQVADTANVTSLEGTIMILSEDYKGLNIIEQPKNAEADAGDSVTFTLNAEGTGLTYQWQKSEDDGGTWTDINDATNSIYTISGVTKDLDGNLYRCVVKDSGGMEKISDAATLTVYASYTLKVVNGHINDQYSSTIKSIKEGEPVHIAANAPTGSESFIKWTWDSGVELEMDSGYSEYSSPLLFTMPSQDITITATYGEKEKYKLTVTNGTYSTTYAEGSHAPIHANDPKVGQKFDHWEWDESVDLKFYTGNANTSDAVIYMPGQNFEITAVYVEDKNDYSLTVVNGTIGESGPTRGSYQSGQEVTLTALESNQEGMPFWKWTSDNGGTIGNEYSTTTSFVMPADNVTVTANYCDQVIALSGYMNKDDFLEELHFPEKVTLTNENGEETSVPIDEWECGNLDSYDSVSNAGEYIFKAKKPSSIPAGYTWPAEGIQYVVKVEQQMVQVSLRTTYANVGGQANTITTTVNGEEYMLTFGKGGEAKYDDSLIFLSKDALEEYIDMDTGDDYGKHGYRLNVTITGKNAENAYLNLNSIVGYKYVEDAAKGGKAMSHAPESYLIGAEPGKVVYSVPVRIMSNGTYCLEFAPDEILLEFYTTDNGGYNLSFHGDAGEGRTYTMTPTEGSDASYTSNGNVFFTVTPPDEEHAWAVMVIPSDRVQTEDESGGVSIDTEWGRELEISWDKPLRFMYYSLIKNDNNNFAAMYLKEEAAVVVSEIQLTENQPDPISPGGKATLSVDAEYQYEKLYGMTGVSYQWYQCDANGGNAVKIEGATGPTYTTDALNAGLYYYYAEAKFDQFVQQNGYYHADGVTMYTDYNSFGWASDTATKSNVFTVAVGDAATLAADVDKDTLKAGEIMTVNAAVTGTAGTPTGTITLYWGDPTDGGKQIAEGNLNNGTATISYNITEEDIYSGPEKELYIFYSGDSNYRSAMKKEDIHLLDGLTITAIPQYEAVTIVWEKPVESVTEYKLWVSPKEGIVIGPIPVVIDEDETAIVISSLPDGQPFENGVTYTFIMEAYYPDGKIVSNTVEVTPLEGAVYNLTVNLNGGSGSNVSGTYADGQEIPINAGTRPGYIFAGWTTSDGGTFGDASSAKTTFTMPANDTTITANWKKESSSGGSSSSAYYSVTFDTNGGEDMDKLRKRKNTQIDLGDYIPERVGYTFVGWYLDKELTEPVDEITLKKNITVYAKWEKADAAVSSAAFDDVQKGDWFYDAVVYAVAHGLMNGMGDGTFQPNLPLTREMLAVVLYNVEGQPESAGIVTFKDVAAGKWYTDAIAWASQYGIVAGYSETEFGLGEPITREQFAAILYRYANFKDYDTAQGGMAVREFSDHENISDYARPAMVWAVNAGIISGMDDGTLMPQGKATRAEAATMLMNFCENIVE